MDRPWRIDLFGGLRARQGEHEITRFRSQKTATLLAYLAFYQQRMHGREELTECLWPDYEMEAGRASLRTALTSLRRQLEPPGTSAGAVLIGDRFHVRLNPAAATTDVAEFENLLHSASRLEEPSARLPLLAQAVTLHRGDLLPGLYDEWVLTERERLAQQCLDALRQLAHLWELSGDLGQALNYAYQVLAADKLDEKSHHRLMRLLTATGQPEAALNQYRDCERVLREEIGEEPGAALQSLARELQHDPRAAQLPQGARRALARTTADHPTPSSSSQYAPASLPTPHLPLQFTRFFGREEELAQIGELVCAADVRLVTMTGPGGSGKTRLAIELARRMANVYGNDIWFVPLADLSDSSLILDAIQDALQVPRGGRVDPLALIAGRLDNRPALLVLDNFEHLVEGGATVVRSLLEYVPDVTCLVTSREMLEVDGEREFSVAPLALPARSSTLEQLAGSASVQLFVDRAQIARPDFQVTRRNAPAVVALCERLEGLPLALEIAASRAKLLSPEQMLTQLSARLDFLVSRRRDVPARHRTIRAALGWSFAALAPDLQRFFAQLSVFRGGWTLEAAQAVCLESRAADFLHDLRERSLITGVNAANSEEMCYRMLETLREYAKEQLTPEVQAHVQRRHAVYYLALASEAANYLHGPEQTGWLDRLESEHDNFRAALLWSRDAQDETETGLRLASALYFFWYVRGFVTEGRRWLDELLARTEVRKERFEGDQPEPALGQAKVRADALGAAGRLASAQGDTDVACALYREELAIREEAGDRNGMADALCHLGLAVKNGDGDSEAHALFEQSLALYREQQDLGGAAHALKCLGSDACRHGDTKQGSLFLTESLALYRKLQNDRGINMLLGELGQLALIEQDFSVAESLLAQHVALSRHLKDVGQTAYALLNFGRVARGRGDDAEARRRFEESLVLHRELGDHARVAILVSELESVSATKGARTTAGAHH